MGRLTVIFLILFLNLLYGQKTEDSLRHTEIDKKTTAAIWVGMKAPNFVLPDTSNNYYFLSHYCGISDKTSLYSRNKRPVVISFFASWCAPCRKEIPELNKIVDSISMDSMQFFLVNVGDKIYELRQFLRQTPTTIPILQDRYLKVAELYGVTSLPRLVVIDKNGMIRLYMQGFHSAEKLKQNLLPVIKELIHPPAIENEDVE